MAALTPRKFAHHINSEGRALRNPLHPHLRNTEGASEAFKAGNGPTAAKVFFAENEDIRKTSCSAGGAE
ncbi:hypothetical protein FGG08_000149 [Glutinoglossum americanum]|uniref:Uncharacterized protein n=1 Tax=Glutinoglossum americanum TaxID=1670608 RepID=A0A9P8IFW4_9PEZI|nr:hypothetical protein FGG08_000149 [Glutinoglossum americanum]